MSLKTYIVDLRHVSDEEHDRLYDLLYSLADTGISPYRHLKVYIGFFESSFNPKAIKNLPDGVLHQVP